MEDFAVTCRLVPDVPHLVSGSCSSSRAFGLGFLQTPPRGDALALLLAFGSAFTWREDFHLARSVPCLAHTTELSCGGFAAVSFSDWCTIYGHEKPTNITFNSSKYTCNLYLLGSTLSFFSKNSPGQGTDKGTVPKCFLKTDM